MNSIPDHANPPAMRIRLSARIITLIGILWVLSAQAEVINWNGKVPLEKVIQNASPNSVIQCDPNVDIEVSKTIILRQPVTLVGLTAHLPDGLIKTPILEVASGNVTLLNLKFTGNTDTVSQDDRAPLIDVHKGSFRIENCVFENSSKDGIMISARPNGGDLVGVIVRDIVGRGNVRDVVSISGDGETGGKVRNVFVENIRGYDSSMRGTVEVSDGSQNVTVRTVYAENCVYGVDIQDHKSPLHVNRHVLIEDVYAKNSKHAVRTANNDLGHTDLTLRNITAEGCQLSIQARNTDRLLIENVRIISPAKESHQIDIRNCDGLIIRNVFILGPVKDVEDNLLIKDCLNVTTDTIVIQ